MFKDKKRIPPCFDDIELLKLDSCDEFYKMLLHQAVKYDHEKAVEFLVKHGADVNSQLSGNTPLHWCQSYKVTEILTNNKADKEVKNKFGTTPLIRAYYSHNYEVMECLLSNSADDRELRAILHVDSNYDKNKLIRTAKVKAASFLVKNMSLD